jgi:hypothetical protein
MTLVAIYYHSSNYLPISCIVPSKEKMIEVCENQFPTDWAHLINQETGEILHTWRKDTLTVSQATQPLSTEQSIDRLNRPQ